MGHLICVRCYGLKRRACMRGMQICSGTVLGVLVMISSTSPFRFLLSSEVLFWSPFTVAVTCYRAPIIRWRWWCSYIWWDLIMSSSFGDDDTAPAYGDLISCNAMQCNDVLCLFELLQLYPWQKLGNRILCLSPGAIVPWVSPVRPVWNTQNIHNPYYKNPSFQTGWTEKKRPSLPW